MNTIGKLLVIVNLLFALATGAFLAVDYAARTEWKAVADERTVELEVIRENSKAGIQTRTNLELELRKYKADLEAALIQSKAKEGQLRLTVEQKDKEIIQHKENAEVAVLNHQKALKEAERLQSEVVLLGDTVKKREDSILDLQGRIVKYANEYTSKENEAKQANARSQNLFLQLKEKEIYIAKLLAGNSGSGNVVMLPKVTDPNFDNPPPVNVKGLIQQIDETDRSLVQISLGSDAGLAKDHTLLVYRVMPTPEYLGRLRLLEVRHDVAIGRVVRPVGMTNASPLTEGDQVATKLQ